MPQIDQILEIYASQLFWLAVVFGLIYFGIGKAMLPKVESTVELRDKRIADDLAAAESARSAATTTEEGYHARIAEARAAATKATAEAKAASALETEQKVKAADADLAAKAAEAEARLNAARSEALAQIGDVAVEATQEIVARVSGSTVSKDAAAKAVQAALASA